MLGGRCRGRQVTASTNSFAGIYDENIAKIIAANLDVKATGEFLKVSSSLSKYINYDHIYQYTLGVSASTATLRAIVKHCRNLHSVSFNNCRRITCGSVMDLFNFCCNSPSTENSWMDLFNFCCKSPSTDLKITDVLVVRLAQCCPNLQNVNLRGCYKITNAAVIELARCCPNLQSVNLRGCLRITDAAVKALVKYCPNLHSIDLVGCELITNAAVVELAQCCPNLQIENFLHCHQSTEILLSHRQMAGQSFHS